MFLVITSQLPVNQMAQATFAENSIRLIVIPSCIELEKSYFS